MSRWWLAAIVVLLPVPSSSQGPPHPACESAETCFGAAVMTEAGLRNGSPAGRIERLARLQEQYAGSVWARRAGLLIGVLLLEREPAEAIRFLRMAQRDFPVLDDYLRLWKGEALLRMGDARQAAALFESIPDAVPETILGVRAAFRAGEAWYQAGDCWKATELLTEAVSQGSQDPAAARALLMMADCQLRDNRPAEGYGLLRQVWVRYPQTPAAREAMEQLAQALGPEASRPSPDELYERASILLSLSLHSEAVAAFQDFLSAAPRHPRQGEARLKLGIALVRLKRYDQAQAVFQDVSSRSSAESREAFLWLARVYLRQDQGDRLLAMRHAPAAQGLSNEQKASLLMMLGTWYSDHDQPAQALSAFKEVVQTEGAVTQQAEGWWRIGWMQYQLEQFHEATGTFQTILAAKEIGSQDIPQSLYWLARALERLRDGKSVQVYADLCRRFPLTYYCLLARSRGVAATDLPSLDGLTGAARETEARQDLRQNLHYRKAVELKLLGLDQEAGMELVSLTGRFPRDRAGALELAALLSEAGAHHQALRVARLSFGEMLEQSGEPVPAALWKIAYPTGYLARIQVHAGTVVDPYLVAAIIREESQYDPRAVSRSGALGLMQLLPTTAQAVARRQGMPDVTREDLFDHETNIRFGTGYLAQLLQRFDGNVLHAVAAYNAGPSAVSTWLVKNGKKEIDEFVESISFQETRQYVKRVLRSYREYRRLGHLPCAAPSLDKVC